MKRELGFSVFCYEHEFGVDTWSSCCYICLLVIIHDDMLCWCYMLCFCLLEAWILIVLLLLIHELNVVLIMYCCCGNIWWNYVIVIVFVFVCCCHDTLITSMVLVWLDINGAKKWWNNCDLYILIWC